MWPFTKKNTVNKTVVVMLPPVLGTFQEHSKVLKKYLPTMTKEEMAYALKMWSDGQYIRFLSPISASSTNEMDKAHQLEDNGWHLILRALNEPSCDCNNYYMSSCCGGINFGIHTGNNIHVQDIKFPESLLSRGSFMEELSENKIIPLTPKEREILLDQNVVFSSNAKILEET